MADAKKNTVKIDTVLDVTLSDALQTTLGKKGIDASAVFFDSSGTAHWTTLVDNGAILRKGHNDIVLTKTVNGAFEEMKGGKIYFLIQSRADTKQATLQSVIKQESDINWNNAQTNDYRYDSFEVTLQNTADDQGNLTSVNGFGLPMELRVNYDKGSPATAGYKISGTKMFSELNTASAKSVLNYTDGPLKGTPRAGVSPTTSVANDLSNYKASDWDSYLADLKSTKEDIVIAGFFNGAADANKIWHNAGFYSYKMSWDATAEVFWLDPTESSQIQGRVQFTEADLANSIYSTLGNLGIYAEGSNTPYQIFQHAAITNSNDAAATMNSGENNQWGAMLAQFLTGFTAGYYNSTGKSLNSEVTGGIELNENWNWDPTYAFGEHLSSGAPTWYDPYSKVFFDYSNSYGSGYSDGLMRQYDEGSPLLPVSEPGQAENVRRISLTIFDDGETPTGYVTPVIYNYIAPAKGGYVTAPPGGTSGASVGLNLANADMILKDDTPITIDIFQGNDTNGDPTWESVTITPDAKTTLWQNWGIGTDADGKYQITASGTATTPGYVLLTNFPGMEKGIHWTRITVGTGDDAKTYNLYTTTDGTNFLNPAEDDQAGALAIDGLATIAPQASTSDTIPTFTVNFLYSATSTLPPDLLEHNAHQTGLTVPDSPVAGTLAGGDFTAIAGQSAPQGSSATSKSANVAFGWTGTNSDPGTAAWITKYTNKIGALNYAEVSLVSGAGHAVSPLLTNADLDGQWTTGAASLGNGVYTVTMKEYLASDTKQAHAIGLESSTLTLTVSVSELGLKGALGGQALKLDTAGQAAKGVDGNWVKVRAKSSADDGSGVAVVLKNKKGALVHAETGETGDVSVADATVATLGGLSLMDGAKALKGAQSVFLPKGLRLGFVSLEPEAWGAEDETAQVTPGTGGKAEVRVGGHVLRIEADNDLSPAALLADAQRQTGEPFVYVQTGQKILVDLAGEAEGGNRIGFVKVDIDIADGSWSVGGVDHGAKGFDAAVRNSLDGDFAMRGMGAFQKSAIWTVAGDTGFYAPVLLTKSGDVVFSPAENGDAGDGDSMRLLGQNFFAFEDGAGTRDFDDMTAQLTPLSVITGGRLDGQVSAPLVMDVRAVVQFGEKFVSRLPDDGGIEHGLTLLSEPGDPARLVVKGKAIFKGAGGVEIDGGAGIVTVGNDGKLALRGPGDVLSLGDGAGPVTIRNDGLIKGDISLGDGDDMVRGTGLFDGDVMLRRGDDTFVGGAGDDAVRGNHGKDRLLGGFGDDELRGGIGTDRIRGGEGEDFLFGGFQSDDLRGGRDDDVLFGGRGDDSLHGGPGDDALFGGPGDDVLKGGSGNDLARGGGGADVFVLQLQNGRDRFEDFDVTQDRVDLTAFNLNPGQAPAQIAAAMGEARNGGTLLDLSDLGGDGAVRFIGIGAEKAGDIEFLL